MKSYNDPAKQKTREKQREFIRQHLSHKRARDTIVACFPGAEKEGEEALEVKEIYDPLGIPRGNVFGLEREPEKAERLRKATLGIKVINSEDLDFFNDTRCKFDVISLDYTGQQGPSKVKTLEEIAERHVLAKRGILCTNYSGKRESGKQKARLLYRLIGTLGGEHKNYDFGEKAKSFNFEEVKDLELEEFAQLLTDIAQKKASYDLSILRESMTLETLMIFNTGSANKLPGTILQAHPIYNEMQAKIKANLPPNVKLRKQKYLETLVNLKILTREQSEQVFQDEGLVRTFREYHFEALQIHVTNLFIVAFGGDPTNKETFDKARKIGYTLAHKLYLRTIGPYYQDAMERYSYNSNKNTIMHFDLFSFSMNDHLFRRFDKIVTYNEKTGEIRINPEGLSFRKFMKTTLRNTPGLRIPFKFSDVPDRVYLGSSWVHPKKRQATAYEEGIKKESKEEKSKEQIYSAIREGIADKDIIQ